MVRFGSEKWESRMSPRVFFFFLDFIYLFLVSGGGREKERERNFNQLSLLRAPLGTWHTIQSWALTGNQTGNFLLCGAMPNWATLIRAKYNVLPAIWASLSPVKLIHKINCNNGIMCSLKKKEILPHHTAWINLEDIMLSEITQSQKENNDDSTYMKYIK